MTSPRLLRPRSYSLQFRILYFFLYWRFLTRLDFAATMTLPPDPTPAASVLAYTDSCTNAIDGPPRAEALSRAVIIASDRRCCMNTGCGWSGVGY